MNVLITSLGSNTSISVIKALRKSGKNRNITIIGTDTNDEHLCAGVPFVDYYMKVPSCKQKENYIKILEKIITDFDVHCLIPIHDLEIEVIAEFKDHLRQQTFVATNVLPTIELCNNKQKANAKARELGLLIPHVFCDQPAGLTFPLIAKPIKGVSSLNNHLLPDIESLEDFLKINKKEDYVIQEFISGTEYTVDTYSLYNGNFYGALARKRIETKAGISTKGVTVKLEMVEQFCEKLLNGICFKGAANIQFIERNNEFYFIEINPRFSGAGILSYEAGFNSPHFTLLEVSSRPLPAFSDLNIKYNFYMTRYWQESFHQL